MQQVIQFFSKQDQIFRYFAIYLLASRANPSFPISTALYLITTFSLELIIASWSILRKQNTADTATPIAATIPAIHTVAEKKTEQKIIQLQITTTRDQGATAVRPHYFCIRFNPVPKRKRNDSCLWAPPNPAR